MNATRLLCADDDEEFLEILQSFFWDRGYETETAGDGMDCMTILREFEPDILVLDRELLWGGAQGVLACMREDSHVRTIPVILTAGECRRYRYDALESPVVAWLEKPFSLSQLLTEVNTCWSADPTRGPLMNTADHFPQATAVPGSSVTMKAEELLRHASHPPLRQISCELHEGVLILRGRVSRYYLKQLAQALVARVEGIDLIDNRIEVCDRPDGRMTCRSES